MTPKPPRNIILEFIDIITFIYEFYMVELHEDIVKLVIVSIATFITAVLWTRDQGHKYGKKYKHLCLQKLNDFRDQAGSYFTLTGAL